LLLSMKCVLTSLSLLRIVFVRCKRLGLLYFEGHELQVFASQGRLAIAC
jgi:hypothetical protein